NEGSASITVIDTATERVVRSIATGAKPRGIAVSADGARLFVSEQAANALVVYHLPDGTEAARIAVGDSPEAVYLSPNGEWLAVAIEEGDVVALVNAKTLEVARKLRMHGRN